MGADSVSHAGYTNTFQKRPSKNPSEEGKWFSAVTIFVATNSVFNVTDENKRSSNSTPYQWSPWGGRNDS